MNEIAFDLQKDEMWAVLQSGKPDVEKGAIANQDGAS